MYRAIASHIFLILLVLLIPGKAEATSGRGQSHSQSTITDRFDLVELNHYYSVDFIFQFTQLIFWDWNHQYKRYEVQAWILADKDRPHSHLPIKLGSHNYHVVIQVYGEEPRVIQCRLFRETWTAHDPERVNKTLFDEKYRKGFSMRKGLND